MEHRSQSKGLQTFLEHWGFFLTALLAIVVSEVLMFLLNLKGKPWSYFFVGSMFLSISGAALIVFAKIPVYRSGKFFTFGVKSVPERLAGCYRWGWRVFLFGTVLEICLLLSRQ
jgi:hypothetical protein